MCSMNILYSLNHDHHVIIEPSVLDIVPESSAKQIGMGASANEDHFVFVLIPYQKPVGLDMAFPKRGHITIKMVGFISFGNRLALNQFVNDVDEFLQIFAALFDQFEILLELRGPGKFTHLQIRPSSHQRCRIS